jgi:heptaprenyl diphosphate synthase
MRKSGKPSSRIAYIAVFTSVALVLSYIESMLPLSLIIALPGIKLGLANIAVMLAFFKFGALDAAFVSLCRIALISLLFGNLSSLLFSLIGGVCAYVVLLTASHIRGVGRIGVSCACAAAHSVGQITAACIVMSNTAATAYLPILLVASVPLGIFTGAALIFIESRLPKTVK